MGKKIVYGIIALLMVLAVAGCAQNAATPEPEQVYVEVERQVAVEEAASEAAGGRAADYAGIEHLIVRNASLSLVVPDTQAALDEVNSLVDELGGYIVQSNVYQYQEGLQASVTFRIPADSLEQALMRVRDLASEVRSENVSGEDVTEEYVDLQSRLRHLQATEQRLLEFLDEAEDTEAALAVYDQLRQVQGELEQVKGRMQYLEQSAAMATVSVEITPDELAQPIQVGGWHPEGTLRNAIQSLIRVLQFLVDAAIVIVILIVPTVALIAAPFVGLFFLIRAIVRRRRARRTVRTP
jgi:TolA-binding protein